jgi:transposase InsO family protein
MQLLHSDLMGPFKVPILGNSIYVATLLDDFSGYGEVFCMKNKKSVQQELPDAIARFQRQSGYKVKGIRTDRGTEYKGALSAFMKRKGIVHQRSSPYTLEQNGPAERYNRTLIERTRALLLHFNLPTLLWAEAITTAACLLNFMSKKGKKKSPWELFYDVKPSIRHLRVFGCLAMVHLPPRLYVRGLCAWEQALEVSVLEEGHTRNH